jgi:hypothetical protein
MLKRERRGSRPTNTPPIIINLVTEAPSWTRHNDFREFTVALAVSSRSPVGATSCSSEDLPAPASSTLSNRKEAPGDLSAGALREWLPVPHHLVNALMERAAWPPSPIWLAQQVDSVQHQAAIGCGRCRKSTLSHPITRKHCNRNAAVKLPREILFVRLRSFSG